jgi:hypothetical protein
MPAETDSIPRTSLSDLFFTLRVAAKDTAITLELLRQHFCVQRKRKVSGDLLWSTAAYNAQELGRLGLLEVGPAPKSRRSFEQLRDREVAITDAGRKLVTLPKEQRAEAYDALFKLMFATHPYLRAFVRAINKNHLFAPVVTSLKDHVSPKYATASALVEDVSRKQFDVDGVIAALDRRMARPLTSDERSGIVEGVRSLLDEVSLSAMSEEPAEFAKKFLLKINDYVLPALLRGDGLTFDYRTHRTLWSLGQEWKLWQSTSDHPEYDGRLVFRTATIQTTSDERGVAALLYDSGLNRTADGFLPKLYNSYIKMQRLTKGTYALAWQLRAVFCFDNRCQESVFDRLMEEHYTGSDEFDLTLEIQRQRGQYDRPLRVGNRNIGLVRVVKK